MVTMRTCMECEKEFHFKGGRLSCSDKCRQFYEIRMRESYNILRKLRRNFANQVEDGLITKEQMYKQYVTAYAERDAWLKDKHIDTTIDWKGKVKYPTDSEEE